MLQSVGVVLHPTRVSSEAIETLTSWARSHALPVFGLLDEIERLECGAVPVADTAIAERSSLLVSLGGDGTMLRTLRLARTQGTPVLGVNFGRLGFLAEVDLVDLQQALSAIDTHAYTLEPRSSVACQIHGRSSVAFNDIALVRSPGAGGSAAVEVVVDGEPFVRYAADAVIIATPTGSTAYSYSAGGPIVSPIVEGLLVIPAAPHSTFNRALMLHHNEHLQLRILRSSGPLAVEVDGNVEGEVGPGDELSFAVTAAAGRVVRLGKTNFYERARRKLQVSGSAEAW
ncbi:MAG: NAD(+)/NADH kinase [Actinomycetes bacterium]